MRRRHHYVSLATLSLALAGAIILWGPDVLAQMGGPMGGGQPPPPQGGGGAAAEPFVEEGDDGSGIVRAEGEEGEGAAGEGEGEEREEYVPVEDEESAVRVIHTICEGARIRRVRVLGNRRVSDDDVLASVRQRAGRVCTDRGVADDAHALWELGFFDDIQVEAEETEGDRIDVIFRVRERPSISDVRYEGNSHVGNSDVDEVMTLREGTILSRPEIQAQVTRLRDLYAEKGYFLARIEPRIERLENNEVAVVFVIQEGLEVTVRRVRFVGNRHITSSELRSIMQTGETGIFSFLSNNDTFDEDHFEEDQTRLQAFYYDRGYLMMRTGTPRIELTPDRHYIDITIPVAEGPRFRVGRLRVLEEDEDGEEREPLGGRRHLREMMPANPGDWFNRTSLAQGLQAITRYYRDQGYAHVDVTPETNLDTDRNTVDLSIVITRGPLTRIERINVRGNTKTRDSVIRRELRITEGDLYNQSLLEQSRAFVQALGYFERVEMSESDGSAPDRIVVNVEVAERPTGTFQVGAGFSSIESFIFTAQIQQQNLFGNGQSLSLQLQLSGLRQLIQLQLVEPYLFGSDWTAAIELFKTVRQFAQFNRDSTGGSLTLGHWLFDRRFTLFGTYRGDYVQIGARTGGVFGQGSGQGLTQFTLLPISNLFRQGFISSLRFAATWDSRDNRLFPMNGFYFTASAEVSDEYLGSAYDFARFSATARWYWELFSGVVLKMNTTAGLVTSRSPDGVPVFERFFLGGIFNVRGFPLNGLGPRLGVPLNYDPNAAPRDFGPGLVQAGEPIGGNLQFYYNLELEFPIIQQVGIRGVVFTDGGNAWNLEDRYCTAGAPPVSYDASHDACRLDLFDIRTSWGFGIRWISPLGPLRFEWGIPFQRRPWEQEIDFQFTIGNFF